VSDDMTGENKSGVPEEELTTGSQDASLDIVRETSSEVIAERHGMFGVRDTGDTSGYGGLTRTVTMPGVTLAWIWACQPRAVAITSRTAAARTGSIVITGAPIEGPSMVNVALS